jgi:hypothetical protein
MISSAVAVFALFVSLKNSRQAQLVAIKETTALIYQEWWGDEQRELRRYFFLEFIPKHRSKLVGRILKEASDVVPDDKGRIVELCYFFDRIGWLGAAGLIDIDYILGPMQHTMRRIWIAVEPLITPARDFKPGKVNDPVYCYGFEWLFKRSNQRHNHQSSLLGRRFVHPSILTRRQSHSVQVNIDRNEAEFLGNVEIILQTASTRRARKATGK